MAILISIVLIFSLLLQVKGDFSLYFATFRACDGNNSNKIESMTVAGGKTFSLCCFASNTEHCRSLSYNLNIQPELGCKNVVQNSTLTEGTCLTQGDFLVEQDEMDENICRFQCSPTNNLSSVYDRISIYSLLPPAEQELTQIQTSETGELKMTVVSHIGVIQFNYTYHISMILSNNSRLPLTTKQCNTHICYFTMTIIWQLSTDDVTIVFNVSNPMYSSLYNNTVNLIAAIVPGCIEDLSLFQDTVTSNAAVIKFRPSKAILKLIPFMADVGKPLVYQIVLNKSDGVGELTQFEMTKTVFQHNYTHQYVAVKFQQLRAFMTYKVSIRGQAGGGNGCLKIFTFTTQKAVPSAPPYLEDFSFSQHKIKGRTVLRLMWKPLSADAAGGVNITYDLQIQPGNISFLGIQQTYIEVFVPDTTLVVHIWSRNEMGQSNNFTKIQIHAINESLMLDTKLVIDFINNTSATAFLQLPLMANVQELAFQWCYLTLNSSTLQCQDYPDYILFNASRDDKILIHYNLNSSPLGTADDILIEYFDFENENDTLMDKKHVRANRTRLSGQTPKPLGQCQNTTSNYPKFFVSVKTNNSWSGMVPAKCYFTRQSKSVQFVHWYNQTTLALEQNCTECNPNQFLIKSYKIYAAKSEMCILTDEVWLVNSSIFMPTMFGLPTQERFLCIQAFGDDNLFNLDPELVEVPQRTEISSSSLTTTLALVIVISIVTIMIAAATYCVFHQCRKRKIHFQQMMATDMIIDAKISSEDYSLPQGRNTNIYKSTESKLNSNISSTDSGHLTISSSNSDFTPQNMRKCDSPDVPNTITITNSLGSTIDSGLSQSQGVQDVQSMQENLQSQGVQDVQSIQENLQFLEVEDTQSIQENLQSQEVEDTQSIQENLQSQEVDVQSIQEKLLQPLGLTFHL